MRTVKQLRAEWVLVLIVLSACLLSVVWVFRVPLLQNPDETSHIDYAFSIYSAGRLLNVRTPPSEWNVHARFEGRKDRVGHESFPFELISHQYTLYLIESTDFQRIRFHPEETVSGDYGTRSYYQRLNANAPQVPARIPDLQPRDNPWLVTGYPFLYYLVVAVLQKAISIFSDGPVWLFFSARLLSTILLAGYLILTYAVLRELRLKKTPALMLTAVVAFFPQTIFISSSVQPDNLTMFLVLLCSYCALLFRQRPPSVRLQLVLGWALAALCVTKYHIFLFTAAAVFAIVISEHLYRRRPVTDLLRQLPILVLPSVLLFAVQLWIVWGGPVITGDNLQWTNPGFIRGVRNAVYDYYRGGQAFISWWGTFGWGDAYLVIGSFDFQTRVWKVLVGLSALMFALVISRVIKVSLRLLRMVQRRRWRMALRVLFSNPLLTNHVLFSGFMIFLYALSNNSFFAQGRHWFPYTLSGFFLTLQWAPRVFRKRDIKTSLSTALMVGLLIYCGVAAYYSLKSITDRYYPTVTSNATR